MNKFVIVGLLLIVAYLATGCGVVQNLRENCHGDLLCEYFLGRDRTETDKQQDAARAAEMHNMQVSLNSLISSAELLEAKYGNFNDAITAIEGQISIQQMQLASLSTGLRVIDIVDPCGNGPGFDEVLVRMSNGDLIAYFEDGGNRFLTILERDKYYRTTDTQHCNFRVTESGSVLW